MSKITFTVPKLLYAMKSHTGSTRSIMSGVYRTSGVLFAHRYDADRDRSALVATDNNRLAILEWPAEVYLADPFEVLIPITSIRALCAPKVSDPPYNVTISKVDGIDPKFAWLARGTSIAVCRPHSARNFPLFREIIPRYDEELRQPITPYFALRPKLVSDAMRLHVAFARLCGKPGAAHPSVTFWNNGWRNVVMTESHCDDMRLRVLIMPTIPHDFEAIKAREAECEAEAAAA